jgi:hypothetical protein
MLIHTDCDGTLERCTVDLLYILKFGHFCDSAQSTADLIRSSVDLVFQSFSICLNLQLG